ncbi:helix-turn-helix domain-containing protein, partial [Moraxella sp. RCAD0137]|uniref:helix-turn-helix domain-containing protein n=1 Tax=Moraxella sp. RCAD0137 TaxID=1775913 RepID=UPI0011AF2895
MLSKFNLLCFSILFETPPKLEVIDHYLTEHSYHSTAKSFGLKRCIVQNWVRLYQTHGI